LAKTYRKIQLWDKWLEHFPGTKILEAEEKFLPHIVCQYYGNQALLIGTPQQKCLLKASSIVNQTLLSPLINSKQQQSDFFAIESELYELPIASGSIDLVILPHTLEFMDHPRKLISEACRVIRPEGHIIICGFNPYSLWGLKRLISRSKHIPWSGHFTPANQVKKWLALADFELMKHKHLLYRPPVKHPSLFKKLHILEWIGSRCWPPFGSIYVLVAQAKEIPLTPIKMRWKQQISGFSLPPVIGVPKPTVRNPSS
jgi:SAM-dependent methyltransferase